MKTKTFLLGFLVGGTAAGITVLLNAPASGKETAKSLQKSMNSMKENLVEIKERLFELLGTIQTASKEGKEAISVFIPEVKELVKRWQKDVKPHQETIKRELNEIQNSLNELEAKLAKDNIK